MQFVPAVLFAAVLPLSPVFDLGVPVIRAASSFPEIALAKGQTDHEWPFSVEAGTLACVEMGGQKVVIFTEPWRTDVPQEFGDMTLPRNVIVSANPLALLASLEDKALYLPFDTLETLIKRLAPFETMGRALCDQAPDAPQQKEL